MVPEFFTKTKILQLKHVPIESSQIYYDTISLSSKFITCKVNYGTSTTHFAIIDLDDPQHPIKIPMNPTISAMHPQRKIIVMQSKTS
ncbi:hypothetical protein PRIPAC_88743 [Pristionchus pacificus]|uniref:Uncharacterized protein n=1 Tax=Pristionchus pacificus TaxID=54126 RepID=A0A2A6CWU6_PRIPA|nr:hypothetical protein PRIPAC_88743 [Pristionchus pacificus]|eukprot:PDM82618.1 hypothetical protein PRIPAC_37011 [Pristionchus pacificus]